MGWAVRTDRIEEVAARLGLTVVDGSRVGRDGRLLSWRLAGVEQAAAEPLLPFFIQWAPGTPLPGEAVATDARLSGLELTGDAERLSAWLGEHRLPVAVRPGPPGVSGVRLTRG